MRRLGLAVSQTRPPFYTLPTGDPRFGESNMSKYGTPDQWALQAAQNAAGILPALVDPGGEVPEISVVDMAERIETSFGDRESWNETVRVSDLDGDVKVWLIVT